MIAATESSQAGWHLCYHREHFIYGADLSLVVRGVRLSEVQSVLGSHAVPGRRGEGRGEAAATDAVFEASQCRLPPSLLCNCQSQVSRPSLGLGLPHTASSPDLI